MEKINRPERQEVYKMIQIRNEEERDFKRVEEITRAAFWNLYVPGCDEHYLTHIMRSHEDFIRELDFVIEIDGQVSGSIMYTKAKLVDEFGKEKDILTFGPVCISPEYQRKGYGKKLIEHSFDKAAALGYDVIVIFGDPGNYVSCGFQSCKKHNVCTAEGTYPAAMLVKELQTSALDGRKWIYHQSSAYEIDQEEAQRFDAGLEKWEKRHQASQEAFYILSHAILQ